VLPKRLPDHNDQLVTGVIMIIISQR